MPKRVVLCCLAVAVATLALSSDADARPKTYVYKGGGCDGRDKLKSFARFLGRKPDGAVDFFDFSNWVHFQSSADWAIVCWDKVPDVPVIFSVPMLPKQGATLEKGARGAYDEQFRMLARKLVKHGRGDAMLRIGWEFNGNWYPWAAGENPAAFRAYFRRIAAAFRSVDGQRFRIVWNPALGVEGAPPEKTWPGDDVVDVIGLDVYNQSWRPADRTNPARRWEGLRNHTYGLDWVSRFAAAHGKPIIIPEWGTGTRPDGHGLGDDPLFIRNMAAWMRANDVKVHGYWDYPAADYNALISTGRYPRAANAFVAEFGGARGTP